MSDNMPVASQTQLNVGNTNAYQEDDDKQRIDLDEYYHKCEQDGTTAMVTGAESFYNNGVLSRSLARTMNLTGCERYDPMASKHNARMGAEGFMQTIVDGFKKFVENIIKYIKMAVNWLVDLVKTLTGYKKTARQVEQAEKEMDNVKKEFKELLAGLGFPTGRWDLDEFIGDPEQSFDRLGSFTILRNKFMEDADTIKRLGDSLPLFIQAVEYMNQANSKMKKASDNLHRVIETAKHNVRKGTTDGALEVESIKQAGLEIKLVTNFDGITTKLSELYNALYTYEDGKVIKQTAFSNEALQNGFMDIKAQLGSIIQSAQVSIKSVPDKVTLMSNIAAAAKRYAELAATGIDVSGIDFTQFTKIVNHDDARAIQDIDYLAHMGGRLISAYSSTMVLIRDYAQFCHGIITALNQTYRQLENLWLWHSRSQQMIYFYVLQDFKAVVELNKQYLKAGMNPYSNGDGIPRVDAFVNYNDRVTLFEKIAGTANDLLEGNINGIMDTIKELSRNLGWTPR